VFVNCNCDCPVGYTGNDCSTQLTPSRIHITKITVRLFPSLKSDGSTWDTAFGDDALPDLYFQLIRGSSNILYDSPTYFENADVANNHVFTPNSPIIITDLTSSYIISLLDYDVSGSDENMAEHSFFIYENDNDFPTTLTIFEPNQPIAVDLELSYQW
jgi:hypothetical protein